MQEGNAPRDAAAQPEEDYYNPVFEKLTGQHGLLTGAVAYALYKNAKREWIQQFKQDQGRRPNDAEFRGHTGTQTDAVLNGYLAQADQLIGQYGQAVIDDVRPAIIEEALRGTFWRSVWPSFVASFMFAGVLAILIVIAALLGFGLPIQIEPSATASN